MQQAVKELPVPLPVLFLFALSECQGLFRAPVLPHVGVLTMPLLLILRGRPVLCTVQDPSVPIRIVFHQAVLT